MNYYIFTVKDHKAGGKTIWAAEVMFNRYLNMFWALPKAAPNLNRLSEGDRVVFYVGGQRGGKFGGQATLASKPRPLRKKEMRHILGVPSARFALAVGLMDFEVWLKPKPIRKLAPRLSFIKDKANWGKYLQGSVIPIGEGDYKAIAEAEGEGQF